MSEKNRNYILYGLLILVVIILVFAFTGFSPNIPSRTTSTNNQGADESGFSSIDSGSTGPGDVSVELTPHDVTNGRLVVDVAVNTHSVDLSPFDLKQITTLEYNGKSIKPITAPSLGGHHNSGELIFEVEEEINSFKIKIKGIPKVEERVFNWQ